jgi:hypothetical protein
MERVNDGPEAVTSMRFQYGLFQSGGDLKKRFGSSSSLGVGFLRKTSKNYVWGLDLNYHFGSDFKEEYIFDDLTTSRGYFLTSDGAYGDVRLFQRGFSTYAQFGKIFPLSKRNPNSGLMVMGGVGFLEHFIFIEVLENNVQTLKPPYDKGYDRRTNGISFSQFVGYWYMHPRKKINFYAGFDFSQSITQSRRDWDFYEGRKLTETRNDYLSGIKLGLVIPIRRRDPKDFYLN